MTVEVGPMAKMTRFGGCAYWDGQRWRCADCNGFTERHGPLDLCTVCHRYGRIDLAERRRDAGR